MKSLFNFTVRLDPTSLETLHGFKNYQSVLEPALSNAMETGIAALQTYASDWMWSNFQDPTGITEDDSWDVQMVDPYLAILGNTVPQAQRLEYGFSGMTDSLGRYFPEWPKGEYSDGYHWAQRTVWGSGRKIRDIFQAAIDNANLQLGRGGP